MIEVLEFIFKSIWRFLGCLILLQGAGEIILIMWKIAFGSGK